MGMDGGKVGSEIHPRGIMSDFFSDDQLIDTRIPSLKEIRARSCPPDAHEGDVIVIVNGFWTWRTRALMAQNDEYVPFFGGDYRDVLEPDDPRLKA